MDPKAKLLLVNLGFFMCYIYWSEVCQLSVAYTERNDLWLPGMIYRELTTLPPYSLCYESEDFLIILGITNRISKDFQTM